jgi:methionyl-tRNA synthetase
MAAMMDAFDLPGALGAVWRVVNRANKYIEETAPWSLAREGRKERLATVLYNLAEAYRFVTVMLAPFMPGLPARVWEQLGLRDRPELATWEALRWGALPPGTRINRGAPLFPRLEAAG